MTTKSVATKTVTAGVDLGGTKIQTVVLSGEKVVGSSRVLTPQTGEPSDVIDAIVGTIRTSLEAAAADRGRSRRASASAPRGRSIGGRGRGPAGGQRPRLHRPRRTGAARLRGAATETKVTVDNDVSVGRSRRVPPGGRSALQEPPRGLGRNRCRRRPRPRRRAPRRERGGGRDRPHGGEPRRSALLVRAPRLRRSVCGAGEHGEAGTTARRARPQDEPLPHHEAARPAATELRRLCEGPQGWRPS